MSEKEPLEFLASYYGVLDAIPTPVLAPKRPTGWGIWSFALAPFAASAIAYLFMSFCASGAASSNSGVPMQLPIDRYALDEIRSSAPSKLSGDHVSNTLAGRSVI